ncbi:MAG: CotH kinase family protein [Lachnospiraceae bacterium]|nr:CotH kinase family protein [Lachnospiraceae bacterium]
MSAGKNIDKICAIITAIAVLITAVFMNGEALGIKADDSVTLGYEDTLFDDSYVHTIDITMDDWDGFIEKATSEEYTNADVTIDGETVKNVGIRAKGNTSLSTVSQLGSQRYSLKIEFDCYEATGNYQGLDKLCLNNLIQDYTMMKDYVSYKLMNEFGVASPLVSFCYITVNGEDWGLYLAVEAVEDSFLQRNYGNNYGDLYKPDSMSFGAGRGKGGDFDMQNMDFDKMGMDNPFERGKTVSENGVSKEETGKDANSESKSDSGSESSRPSMQGNPPGNFTGGDTENGKGGFPGGNGGPGGSGFPGGNGGPGGFPGMGSSDVKLQYSDNEIDSYSTIFNNAKTKVKTSDKKRLISSLKSLSEGIANADTQAVEKAVNTDEVMRYMVVHNFLINGDSYTGNMIHNYYLYEENGLLSMIPWDYNLAFGTFQGQDATATINDPIDTPLSVTDDDTDRPMFSWITSSEEYTEEYHALYQEFLEQFYESGYLTELVSDTYEMIREYVEKDPTKFCTMEEFEKAVKTMESFVTLRCESIDGQLSGLIPTTDAGQKEDDSNLIDASDITLSDMGSMGGGFQGGKDQNGDMTKPGQNAPNMKEAGENVTDAKNNDA